MLGSFAFMKNTTVPSFGGLRNGTSVIVIALLLTEQENVFVTSLSDDP